MYLNIYNGDSHMQQHVIFTNSPKKVFFVKLSDFDMWTYPDKKKSVNNYDFIFQNVPGIAHYATMKQNAMTVHKDISWLGMGSVKVSIWKKYKVYFSYICNALSWTKYTCNVNFFIFRMS